MYVLIDGSSLGRSSEYGLKNLHWGQTPQAYGVFTALFAHFFG